MRPMHIALDLKQHVKTQKKKNTSIKRGKR